MLTLTARVKETRTLLHPAAMTCVPGYDARDDLGLRYQITSHAVPDPGRANGQRLGSIKPATEFFSKGAERSRGDHEAEVSKGKAGRAVELGVPVCVVEDQFQFIVHHKILWEGSDTDIAVSIINETLALYPAPRVCSFDRGFHSPGNRALLDAMLDVNALSRKGRLSVAEREREDAPAFAKARRQHPAIESAINNLEHRGPDRVRAPTAPMGLHTRLPCRYWPLTCTASVWCDGACTSYGSAVNSRGKP